MTQEEAIAAREELLAEQRKLRLAVRVLQSDTIVPCAGISMAIGQYNRRIVKIDEEIRELADQYALSLQEEAQTCEVEFQMAEETTPATAPATPTTIEEATVSVAESTPAPEVPVEETTVQEQPAPAAPQFTQQQLAVIQLLRNAGIIRPIGG